MNEKYINNRILHGNSARLDPKRPVTPLFENSITNDFSRRGYHRLDEDEYDYAALDIREVDSNPLS
jgi:hypothetical protein